MDDSRTGIKKRLMDKGVRIPAPESVEIGKEVEPERISGNGVVIHAGCRIFGSETCICEGAEIGLESPATIDNCHVGPGASLKGGFFSGAVFLDRASCGSCAHVREGTILEEEAGIAHSVGLKQTILFPYVTLGSLINFCDCLMAGGTDRRNHSEVGSSYIHFNYTPQQDKATPSLIGDVPAGVMLDNPPIFLGGQGGLVGPCRLAYGITIAAGTICRKDELRPSRLIFGGGGKSGNIAHPSAAYRNIKRITVNNLVYIGNLAALSGWYRNVRSRFVSDGFSSALYEGLCKRLDQAVNERIKRLDQFIENLEKAFSGSAEAGDEGRISLALKQKKALCGRRAEIKEILEGFVGLSNIDSGDSAAAGERFLQVLERGIEEHGKNYIKVVKSLPASARKDGTSWLRAAADSTVESVLRVVPEISN